jgi:adenosylcobinamide-phosphate synthase
VAGFGRWASWCERLCYADSRVAGVAHLALTVGPVVGVTALVGRRAAGRPGFGRETGRAAAVAVGTWVVLGGTSLTREATALADSLDAGDLPAARDRIPHLCGRDPSVLDAAGMARAGCESIAENTSDAVVGPLFWGAVAGVPGLVGYRVVNTLDAMVGHRSPHYRNFGWAAARCDDLLNLAPARLTAGLTVALARPLGGSPGNAWRAWRRDARGHPSPNAGPVEAAAAGALGIRLGGRTVYPHVIEDRPVLGGDGRAATAADLRRTARLSRWVSWSTVGLSAALALALDRSQACRTQARRAPELP